MNSYPPELIVQLAPLMFVAGLDDTNDPFIARLRAALLSLRKQAIYHPTLPTSFHVQLVDKNVSFPPRKSAAQMPHSPLSPLTPSSPLYPDGIIAPIWLRKHSSLLPSVFVLFLPLSEDNSTEDTTLCSFISSRKRLTSERNIKLTVVLLASRRLLDHPDLEPRLTFIRRQSALDPRASLFVLSPVANSELSEFLNSLQAALADVAAEYYAAHSRRVRRKRNKHSHPSPALPTIANNIPIPRPLKPEGWSIRYSYKLAAFAEFRGEFQVALKHYQEAYSALCLLFSSTAPLQTISSSSVPPLASLTPLPPRTKRWAEAKVLSDSINIKIIKLFLYNNEHSLACAQHHSHLRLFTDMSEHRWAIGESTFEFWSWLGRQYRVLAELIDQGLRSTLVLPSHAHNPSKSVLPNVDLDPLKSLNLSNTSSGLNPTHALLHPGYYYYTAARCIEMRRKRFLVALQAEAENNQFAVLSPGFANEKKVDHLGLVVELYTKAYEVFKSASFSQSTTAAGVGEMQVGSRQTLWIAYRIAETYREGGKFDLAVRFFDRIAKIYRKERWNELLKAVLEAWFECLMSLGGQVEEGVKVLIELIALGGSGRVDDLMRLLKTTKPRLDDSSIVVDLIDSSVDLFKTNSAFYLASVKFSDEAAFQIHLSSSDRSWRTWEGGGGVGKVEVWFKFEGGERRVVVLHRNDEPENEPVDGRVRKVDLGEVVLGLGEDLQEKVIEADLRWDKEETVVFCGFVRCFKVGIVEVSRVVVIIEEPENGWVVEVPIVLDAPTEMTMTTNARVGWWLSSLDPVRFVALQREEGCSSLTVEHRDHLIQISFSHQAPAYVDEEYAVDVEVRNLDERPLEVTLGFLVRPGETEWVVNWIIIDGERSTSLIKGIELGVVEPGECVVKRVWMVCTGLRGERVVDVEVLTGVVEAEGQESHNEDTMEHLEVLVVEAVEPFSVEYEVMYLHSACSPTRNQEGGWPGLADLKTFDVAWWDQRGKKAGDAAVCGRVVVGGGGGEGERVRVIVVEKITLEREDGRYARVFDSDIDCAVDGQDLYPAEYIEGDEFCVNCLVSICIGDDDDEGDDATDMIEGPGRYCVMWHPMMPDGTAGPNVKTLLRLPMLRPPVPGIAHEDDGDQKRIDDESDSKEKEKGGIYKDDGANGLVALLQVPAFGQLHVPLGVELLVRNHSPVRTANVGVSFGGAGAGAGGETEADHGGKQGQQQFVIAGIKNGRIGVVLPGEEVRVVWVVVPLECGYLNFPRVRVLDWRGGGGGEEGNGEEVVVVDARSERKLTGLDEGISILVLP